MQYIQRSRWCQIIQKRLVHLWMTWHTPLLCIFCTRLLQYLLIEYFCSSTTTIVAIATMHKSFTHCIRTNVPCQANYTNKKNNEGSYYKLRQVGTNDGIHNVYTNFIKILPEFKTSNKVQDLGHKHKFPQADF